MRGVVQLRAFAALCLATCATAAPCRLPIEQEVLAVLNAARTDPAGFARSLRTFRTYFNEVGYALPGSTETVETSEGVGVVDETIAFLAHQAPLGPLQPTDTLTRSAAVLAADQARSGEVGHQGSDGLLPGDRAQRLGGGEDVAEVIAYGAVDAVDAVRQLIVDDGVADRGHRGILYSPDLRFAGVSCGPHREFGTMCVIDLSPTPTGRFGQPIRFARMVLPRHGLR